MANELEEVLMRLGPCLSGSAAAELERAYRMSAPAARQRISRRELPVRALDLPFPRKASFLYLTEQFQTEQFFTALTDALEQSNGAYARAIYALRSRGGIMPVAHFAAASAMSQASSQLSSEVVRQRLVSANVLKELEVPGCGTCVAFAATTELDEPFNRMKARLVAEEVLLGAVKHWARNLAFGSYELFTTRGDKKTPTVCRFEWDMTAPSYLSGLAVWDEKAGKPKPGSLVFDVLLGRTVDERALRPFLYKCETMRQLKVGRCMQFFLAESFTPEALNQLRKNGIVPGRVDELFGRDVAQALRELLTTLTQAAEAVIDPNKFERLFTQLGRFEGAAGTLRGALFEFVAAELLRESGGHNIVMNKLYREKGKDLAEVDIRAELDSDLLFVECKGILPGKLLDDEEVENWLTKRVPAVYTRVRDNDEFSGRNFKFELWTTGELSDAAKAMVAQMECEIRPTKYTVAVRYGPELRQMATTSRKRNPTLLKVLEQHFLASPLSDLNLPTLSRPPRSALAGLLYSVAETPTAGYDLALTS